MNPLAVLLLGTIVVIAAILALRLHAFLALILGALVVAGLTSESQVLATEMKARTVEVVGIADDGSLTLRAPGARPPQLGLHYPVLAAGRLAEGDPVELGPPLPAPGGGQRFLAAVRNPDGDPTLVVGDHLIHHADLSAARATAGAPFIERIATGFGNAAREIGILIVVAAIIGKCLLDSGAAERIVLAARGLLGDRHAPLAFLGSGFLLGIPVFFDTVFYLLLPLGKAMRLRIGGSYVLLILSIVAGATMTHSLVPPTPGPLFVAQGLGVDIGAMMMGGIVVGLFTVMAGYLYALWANRRWDIPLRPSSDLSAEELEAMSNRDATALPPLWISLLPILLPVVLISGATIADALSGGGDRPVWLGLVRLLGDKNLALLLAAAIGMALLAQRHGQHRLALSLESALESGGVIVLIVAAGGAFGHVLGQTDIAGTITGLAPEVGLDRVLLPLAFLVTALIRIALGSATVAMITAVGIVAPIAGGMELSYHPLYLALAIGAGSKPIPWMNDSGFWVISRMSGFTEAETLKTASVMMSLMGVVGLIVTMLGAWLVPLV